MKGGEARGRRRCERTGLLVGDEQWCCVPLVRWMCGDEMDEGGEGEALLPSSSSPATSPKRRRRGG